MSANGKASFGGIPTWAWSRSAAAVGLAWTRDNPPKGSRSPSNRQPELLLRRGDGGARFRGRSVSSANPPPRRPARSPRPRLVFACERRVNEGEVEEVSRAPSTCIISMDGKRGAILASMHARKARARDPFFAGRQIARPFALLARHHLRNEMLSHHFPEREIVSVLVRVSLLACGFPPPRTIHQP